MIQHRSTQLLQPGERQLHLRLDTRRAHQTAGWRLPRDVVQQRRLAHSWLADQHQRPALTSLDGVDEIVESAALAAPARQLSRASSDRGPCRYLHVTDATRAGHRLRPLATGGCERATLCLTIYSRNTDSNV